MCNATVALAVLGGAQSGLQFAGKRRQEKQQLQFQQAAAEAERQRALMEQRSLGIRQAQEEVAMRTELGKIEEQAVKSRGAVTVAKGQSNVAGLSVDAVLNDYYNQEAQNRAMALQQRDFRNVQAGLASTDASFRSKNRLIDINRPVARTSFAQGAINLIGSTVKGARTGMELKREFGTPKTPLIS
tara:strand:- start:2265 stop:2822 length:558 start_codon:yes stop_codon:yes gene_type:complete